MGHIQHLSLESLVKIDHFQKEPPEIPLRADVRLVPIDDIKQPLTTIPQFGRTAIEVIPAGRPTEQVAITCYFKAKMFEMLSRLAISFAV
jgi:hypothetical protein